jgi:hypothetical protein
MDYAGLEDFALKDTAQGVSGVAVRRIDQCPGLVTVDDGRIARSLVAPTVEFYVSPPADTTECEARGIGTGAYNPDYGSDGGFLAFLASPKVRDGSQTGHARLLCWWPAGAADPIAVGAPMDDVGAIVADPRHERVATFGTTGKSPNLTIVDLRSGTRHVVVDEAVADAQFSPDGSRIAYVGSDHSIHITNL